METLKKLTKPVSNNHGLTLVELLAGIVLISILLVLISSIHLMGVKQYSVQSETIQNQTHVRLAMNTLTKAVRSAGTVQTTASNELTLTTGSQTTVYSYGNSALLRNGSSIISGISNFTVTQTGNQVTLTLESTPNAEGATTKLSTSLYIRQGS